MVRDAPDGHTLRRCNMMNPSPCPLPQGEMGTNSGREVRHNREFASAQSRRFPTIGYFFQSCPSQITGLHGTIKMVGLWPVRVRNPRF